MMKSSMKNPDSGSIIYLTTAKVAQYRLEAENREKN